MNIRDWDYILKLIIKDLIMIKQIHYWPREWILELRWSIWIFIEDEDEEASGCLTSCCCCSTTEEEASAVMKIRDTKTDDSMRSFTTAIVNQQTILSSLLSPSRYIYIYIYV